MGHDAIVKIWVGVRSEEDCEISEIVNKLPRDIFDEEGSLVYHQKDVARVKEKYGCVLERIYCSDELVGLGVIIFTHDWDFGVVKFDIAGIGAKRTQALLSLGKIFKDNGIDDVIAVWCQTDYR